MLAALMPGLLKLTTQLVFFASARMQSMGMFVSWKKNQLFQLGDAISLVCTIVVPIKLFFEQCIFGTVLLTHFEMKF